MNKTHLILLSSLFFVCLSSSAIAEDMRQDNSAKVTLDKNSHLLPNQFSVFTDGKKVINHYFPGFVERVIRVDNSYQENPGCYITCYTHNPRGTAYLASGNIYAMGMIRIPGSYKENICQPTGSATENTSASQDLKNLCNLKFKNCMWSQSGCWAGGDTGGWM